MLHQHVLGLAGGDVLTRPLDHVLHTGDERGQAVGVLAHEVPGLQPAVAHDLRGRVRVLEIARHERDAGDAGDAQLAGLTATDRRAVAVGDAAAVAEHDPPEAVVAALAVQGVHQRWPDRLGHPVQLQQGCPDVTLPGGVLGGGEVLGEGDDPQPI